MLAGAGFQTKYLSAKSKRTERWVERQRVTCMTYTAQRTLKIKHASKESKYPRLRPDISNTNISL
jgi:hypothetical protein